MAVMNRDLLIFVANLLL